MGVEGISDAKSGSRIREAEGRPLTATYTGKWQEAKRGKNPKNPGRGREEKNGVP